MQPDGVLQESEQQTRDLVSVSSLAARRLSDIASEIFSQLIAESHDPEIIPAEMFSAPKSS